MTTDEAKRQGLPPGYALRMVLTTPTPAYLSDYRTAAPWHGTIELGEAEWFGRLIDASEVCCRLNHLHSTQWVVVMVSDDRQSTTPTPTDAPLLTIDDAFLEAMAAAFELDDDEAETLAASVIGPPVWRRTDRGTMRLVESVSRPLMDGTVNGDDRPFHFCGGVPRHPANGA